MKKIGIGLGSLALCCLVVASLQNGALKADELLQESSEEVATTIESTANTESSVLEITGSSGGFSSVASESSTEAETPQSSTTNVSSELPSEFPASSVSEPPLSESSASESASSSSESSSSGSSSSETSPTSATASSSRPPSAPSTSSSGNISSNNSSSETSSSSVVTSPSQSSSEPVSAPSASEWVQPPSQKAPSVASQSKSTPLQEGPAAFSETSTLQLPSELKTAEVAQSDLKGYELPLLASFENPAQAALIYDGIKLLGLEQPTDFDASQLAAKLYRDLFAQEPVNTPSESKGEMAIGSLLYQKDGTELKLLGIYIGQEYYLTVEDVEVENEAVGVTEDTEEVEKKKQRQVTIQLLDSDAEFLVEALPEAELTEYGQEILKEYPASINFTANEGTKNFIAKIAEDARKLGQEYDVFASVMIAQALLESGSGTSGLSLAPNHNLFGIKGTYQGQAVSMATQEDRGNGELYTINSAFRKYPNYAASLGDYVQLLRKGIAGNAAYYQKTWRSTAKNYLRTTQALTGTYATDISYGKKLNSIIAVYNLTQYDRVKVEEASGIFIKGKAKIPEEYRTIMRYPDYNGVNYNTSGSYPVGQCTWYAFNRVKQLGKSVDDYMGNGGQWGTKGQALGYEISREPKTGWLISFTPGTAGSDPRYGHVAFVEAVRPEGILISEGNVYGGTVISYRVIDMNLAKSNLVTYIKAK